MRYLLLTACVLSCLHATAQQDSYPSLQLPDSLTADAHALVRLDEMQVTLHAIDEMAVSAKRVVTVLDPQGNDHLQAYLRYSPAIRIKKLGAVVYDAQGREVQAFKERQFTDVSAVSGGTLYSDARVKYVPYTPGQYPYTFEFSYEFETPNTGVLPSWHFLDNYNIPTERSSFEIRFASPELRPECVEYNLEGISVDKLVTDHSIRYTALQVPAIKAESLSPSFRSVVPRVHTRMVNFQYEGYEARIQDWATMGRWINQNLLEGQSTISRVRSLVAGVEDPLEKARLVYEYVQTNTRYISVQVGIGGLKPISAIEVDKVKYGDCKGLSNYTMALLQAVGVTAYYVHVQAGRDKVDFIDGFPDLAQGNHVILAVSDGERLHWIDCTSRTAPFGFLGDFTDDRRVLIMKPEGGVLARTPAYKDDANRQETRARYALDILGGIAGEVQITTSGIQYDNHYGLESQSADDHSRHYKRYWPEINNLKLRSLHFSNNREAVRFTEEIHLEAQGYASTTGELMLFAPNAFNRWNSVPKRYRERQLPLQISRGFLDEDQFVIGLPEGYRVESLPEVRDLETDFGIYHMGLEYDADTHSLTYKRRLLLKENLFPANRYEDYRQFRKMVAASDNALVVLVKS